MLYTNFLVLFWVAIATTSAQVLDCTEYIGHTFSVPIDGNFVEYMDVELYYRYDKDLLVVNEFPDEKSANLDLGDNKISFRGIVVKNGKIDNNYSIRAEKPVDTKTVGFAKEIKHGNNMRLSHCQFAVKKKPNAITIWPQTLQKKIIHAVNQCLQSELCESLGQIKNQ